MRHRKPEQVWWWDWDGRLMHGPVGGPGTPHTGPTNRPDGSVAWYRDGFPCEPPEPRQRVLRPVEHVRWRLEEVVEEVDEETLSR